MTSLNIMTRHSLQILQDCLHREKKKPKQSWWLGGGGLARSCGTHLHGSYPEFEHLNLLLFFFQSLERLILCVFELLQRSPSEDYFGTVSDCIYRIILPESCVDSLGAFLNFLLIKNLKAHEYGAWSMVYCACPLKHMQPSLLYLIGWRILQWVRRQQAFPSDWQPSPSGWSCRQLCVWLHGNSRRGYGVHIPGGLFWNLVLVKHQELAQATLRTCVMVFTVGDVGRFRRCF